MRNKVLEVIVIFSVIINWLMKFDDAGSKVRQIY